MHPDLHNMRLNEQQVDMIRLFQEPMPQEDYDAIKQFVVQMLAKKLDAETEKWEQENNITEAYYEDLSKQHFRAAPKGTSHEGRA